MDRQTELLRTEFGSNQQTYRYYLMGLTVTAIGFAIYNTQGLSLQWIQTPLAIAVFCWSGSVFSGLNYLKRSLKIKSLNIRYLSMPRSSTSDILASNKFFIGIGKKYEIAERFSKVQEYLFYGGTVSFIFWHILEMYSNTVFV